MGEGRRVFTAALPEPRLPACLTLHRKRQLLMKSATALKGNLGEYDVEFKAAMNGTSQDDPASAVSELHIHQRYYVTITTTTT